MPNPTPSIVERLRELADRMSPGTMDLLDEPADEIENLRRTYGDAADREELMQRWEVEAKKRNALHLTLERVGKIATQWDQEGKSDPGWIDLTAAASTIRSALHNDKGEDDE